MKKPPNPRMTFTEDDRPPRILSCPFLGLTQVNRWEALTPIGGFSETVTEIPTARFILSGVPVVVFIELQNDPSRVEAV